MSYDARYEQIFAKYAENLSAPYGVELTDLADYRKGLVATIDDLEAISKDEARRVLHAVYWQWRELYRLPEYMQAKLFESMISDGAGCAIREVQRKFDLEETGIIDAEMAKRVREGKPHDQDISDRVSEDTDRSSDRKPSKKSRVQRI